MFNSTDIITTDITSWSGLVIAQFNTVKAISSRPGWIYLSPLLCLEHLVIFFQVGRALRPGGTFAVVGYDFSRPHPDHPQANELTAAMFSVYKATGAHWSKRRRLVDERYASIPAPAWTQRSEKSEHLVTSESSLGAWSDYIRSWSGFQQMSMQAGEGAADHLISSFLDTCRNSLDLPTSTDPHQISLKLATQYWVTVYQK